MKIPALFGITLLISISLISCSKYPKTHLLVFSKTDGFRHESIEAGQEALQSMAEEKKFAITFTEDSKLFNDKELIKYTAVVFLNTTGDVLNPTEQEAFERYIQAGGGFVGIHSATDTEYDWPWYSGLAGAYFQDHPIEPGVQKGTFIVTQKDHWATRGMPDTFELTDEFYSFKNISPNIEVVLEIDNDSYIGGSNPDYHPMSWYHEYDGGRAFYTALGHTSEMFSEELFLNHLWAGIHYATGGDAPRPLDYSLSRPEENRFTKVVLAEKLDEPMELAVLDDERILFIQRKGEVRLFNTKNNELKTIAKLPVSIYYVNKEGEQSAAEDGLLGLNIDPNFAENNWIYLYYSPPEESVNVLSRFVLNGDSLDLTSEKVLLKVPVQREECCHAAGSIAWDSEGNLYLSTGDNTNPHASDGYSPSDERPGRSPWDAQKSSANTNDLRGKILRIKPNADGTYSIPEGNLFSQGTPKTRPEIYTMGHRNPFRISVDQHTGYVYWGDVGPDASDPDSLRGPAGHDEVGQARSAGNFGWPHFVGDNKAYNKYDFAKERSLDKWDASAPVNTSPNNTGLEQLPPARNAFIWYPYAESKEFPLVGSGGRNAMAGPVYYFADFKDAERAFPKYYNGKLFTYEWMRGWIMAVTMDSVGNLKSMERFMPSYRFSNPMDMQFASNGDLYMLEYGTGWFTANDDARLIRIEYNKGNRPPQIQIASHKMGGAVPFDLELNAEATTDPDRDDLKYSWEITSENGFKKTIRDAKANLTLDQVGIYQVTLSVNDGKGGISNQSMEIIAGNEPPVITFELANGNKSFYVPNTYLDYTINVTDLEDGSLGSGIDTEVVSVTIDYLEVGYDRIAIAQGHRTADALALGSAGLKLIDASDCRSCHLPKEKSLAPSYLDIALKYKSDETAVEYLSQRIISGGGGVWGETAMAAHPQMSAHDAAEISKYILSLADEDSKKSLPTQGSFPAKIPSGDQGQGVFIVRAAYKDRGANGLPGIMEEETFVLRSSRVSPHDFDEYVDVNKLSFGGSDFAIPAQSRSYMVLRQVDLSGLSAVHVSATAPIAQLNAIGGKLELRIGSSEGALLGTSDFLEPSTGGFESREMIAPIALPDTVVGKPEDLFLVFVNDRSEKPGSLMVVLGVEFKMVKEPRVIEPEPVAVNVAMRDPRDFFAGRWNLTITGTPDGDTKFIADLKRSGGKLTGSLLDPNGQNPALPINDISESSDQIEIFFTAQGFNVNVLLKREGQNMLKGKMMGMFDAAAMRMR